MPLYEFQCKSCGLFEQWRGFNESSDPMLCPNCQTMAKRIYSSPNLHLRSVSTAGSRSKRIEEKTEPRLITREPKETTPKSKQAHRHERPWMLSH
jgi:putative FmdB family regulatory protein